MLALMEMMEVVEKGLTQMERVDAGFEVPTTLSSWNR